MVRQLGLFLCDVIQVMNLYDSEKIIKAVITYEI